jgi:mannose-6-phosphate isomerase-like protein (cupin superfamily)
MAIIDGAGQFHAPDPGQATHFAEHLRTGQLSVGTYSLPAGGHDDQTPHREDEVYVVTRGAATFVDDSGSTPVGVGDTIVVAAGVPHRFVDITDDLCLVVVFAPPYHSQT